MHGVAKANHGTVDIELDEGVVKVPPGGRGVRLRQCEILVQDQHGVCRLDIVKPCEARLVVQQRLIQEHGGAVSEDVKQEVVERQHRRHAAGDPQIGQI